ncbi:MAG: diphosphomevalonate decarboxylase [Candidatus Peribacteraceae bacterium]
MIKAQSSPNIALIKYWGNRNNELRLPAADSLSMVLDTPTVEVIAEHADIFSIRSFDAEGNEKTQKPEAIERLKKHWQLTRQYLSSIGRNNLPEHVSLTIHSHIPQAIGIASSAAVFSCLAEAYAGFVGNLSREDVAILGRLGSGSGARNSFGGYVALENSGDGFAGTVSRQIANETHWMLHDIIVVPSQEEKKVGSTEGHAMAHTSPIFEARVCDIPRRMKECEDALRTKDFEKLQRISEEDALDMHRVMETQTPSLQYLSAETHRIVHEIEALRKSEKLNVLYTMDAGPTVHLICTEDSRNTIEDYASSQKGCVVFRAKTGSGSRLL